MARLRATVALWRCLQWCFVKAEAALWWSACRHHDGVDTGVGNDVC
jgi:hypothetical protein